MGCANVRISTDGGATWNLLTGDDPYDFNYGYGWIYNESEYDCGGSLEQVAAGWGGQADWHEVNFDLSAYEGQEVIVNSLLVLILLIPLLMTLQ